MVFSQAFPVYRIVALLMACGLVSACDRPAPPIEIEPAGLRLDSTGSAWILRHMRTMTLEQKVGQLFSVQVEGVFESSDDPAYIELLDLVRDVEVGGLIFFQGTPLTQAATTNDLQAAARIPLMVSQDMEWGAGMRVEGATRLPAPMVIGASRDPALAYQAGRVTAAEALALGVHQVLAPVADINNNAKNPVIDIRAFGDRGALVAEMGAAFARGLQEGGVLATLKHFPGHGDTAGDSHQGLPIIRISEARMDSVELAPYRVGIAEGIASIMIGHIAFPNVDPVAGRPATLSPVLVDSLLRKRLGFSGLVITDALNMSGITRTGTAGEIAVRALEAGVDMLLMSTDVRAARRHIFVAIESGRLSLDRINMSVLRILHAKALAGLHLSSDVRLEDIRRDVGGRKHRVLAETVARSGLTLLRNQDEVLPLLGGPARVLVVTIQDSNEPDADAIFEATLAESLPGAEFAWIGFGTPAAERTALLRRARSFDRIVIAANVSARTWQQRPRTAGIFRGMIEGLRKVRATSVLVVLGSPYGLADIGRLPDAVLVAYGSDPSTQRAAAHAVTGRATVDGRLPVSIPGQFEYDSGLRLAQRLPRLAEPDEAGMDGPALARVDSVVWLAIADRAFPGAAIAIGRGPALVRRRGFGYYTYESERPVTPESQFDLASLTKVIATTTAVMKLYEAGRLELDAPVARYIPEFGQQGKTQVTVRQLLSHTGGLIPFRPFYRLGYRSRKATLRAIFREGLAYEPGTESRYSDFGPIVLAVVVERITGRPFDAYARTEIFEPLGMWNTGFRKVGGRPDKTVVPTERDDYWRHRLLQGEVHDETASLLGGVAGHAGLFSNVDDLSRFAFMLVNEGRSGDRNFLKPETIRLFTTPVDPSREEHTRALGWDTRSPEGYSSAGEFFGPGSFGHTGFTGTSLWVDPDAGLFVILLSNRIYPTRDNRGLRSVRPAVADLVHATIRRPLEAESIPAD